MIPVLSIVGNSNSGKTTLIERIIPELKSRDLKIGTLKHVSHKIDLDIPGKDSYRHKQAGSDVSMVFSPTQMAVAKTEPYEALQENMHHFKGMDMIITEGLKKEAWPKMEVFRPQVHKQPVCLNDPKLMAIVSSGRLNVMIPQFKINDIFSICNFIENNILKEILS